MTRAGELRSGKGHRDENFPVASHLIAARHRAPILAFYEFVRVADDIADHAELTPDQKLALLDRLEASLLGDSEEDPEGVRLKRILAERSLSPRHAQDLIAAFRLDVNKLRYRDWDELIHYCSLSAMPVGRYVLDVHGESRSTWAASDAICAALQINNHLQDCKADYLTLDRVYVPLDVLTGYGTSVEAIGAREASPQLRSCLRHLADRTAGLLRDGAGLPDQVRDLRLSLEISVIHTLAERIVQMLMLRDPLSERVHLGKTAFAGIALIGIGRGLRRRLARRGATLAEHQDA
ncbi:squalene synthase HpnC [Xanthobacteraceae bacterium Astr-EGSB]|uniref:squalene synthase HpnC n=1 Tax=Astrobacterium formosum TaxID=3069710 RepID=UPI0027B1DBC9|nr:squalene synthase HpnC [Xanthobacteraceae bacterium Astr-EGSB]